jgi:CRISPR-associated protein Csm5
MTQYRLTVLTPLLVGGGDRLSPIDYMIWKDQVNVLDQQRIFRLLAKGPRLDPYLTQLRRADKLDFASWGGFAQNYAGRRIPFEHPSMTPIWSGAPSDQLHIPTFASGPSGAFLPASALKGALRTAYVFTRWNPGVVKEVANRLEGERGLRRPGPAAENMALGSSGHDPMRVISAGDSGTVATTQFKVFLARVATMVPKGNGFEAGWKVAPRGTAVRPEQSSPIFAEMAIPGTEFRGAWRQDEFLRSADIARHMHWSARHGQQEITAAANEFAAHLLAEQRKYADTLKLARVAESLGRLQAELESVRSQPCACLINLGWGGGLLSKAPVPDAADEDYRRIVRALPFYERAVRSGMPFPKTRKVLFLGGEPGTMPGWAKLEVA